MTERKEFVVDRHRMVPPQMSVPLLSEKTAKESALALINRLIQYHIGTQTRQETFTIWGPRRRQDDRLAYQRFSIPYHHLTSYIRPVVTAPENPMILCTGRQTVWTAGEKVGKITNDKVYQHLGPRHGVGELKGHLLAKTGRTDPPLDGSSVFGLRVAASSDHAKLR